MKTLLFYSFKGGSGRTVASANVAAALAKNGKRVLIIDMDFEAPGLQHVFQVEKTKKYINRKGIQDYLKGKLKLEDLRNEIIIDLINEENLIRRYILPEKACFLYFMAAPKTSVVFTGQTDYKIEMKDLIKYLEKTLKLDYIIMDSASGLRDSFTLSIGACDKLFIFFRWTVQHVEGTLRVLKMLKMSQDINDSIYRPFKLIASAVPPAEELERRRETDEALVRMLLGAKKKAERQMDESYGEDARIFHEIPELLEMKWQESIIVFDRKDTTYETLAKKIINL